MITVNKPTKKPTKKPVAVPAHPDLIPGLERLGLPTHESSIEDVAQHPMYHEALTEILDRVVPA